MLSPVCFLFRYLAQIQNDQWRCRSLASCLRRHKSQSARVNILRGTPSLPRWSQHNHVRSFIACFGLLFNMLYLPRYNVYERIKTLFRKKNNNKKIDFQSTFFPKRKRVLNSAHALRVLNKPAKKQKTAASETQIDCLLDSLLDSQVSIASSFLDSQGCAPASPATPEQNISLLGYAARPPPRAPSSPVGKCMTCTYIFLVRSFNLYLAVPHESACSIARTRYTS